MRQMCSHSVRARTAASPRLARFCAALAAAATLGAACGRHDGASAARGRGPSDVAASRRADNGEPLVVLHAGSLARPLRAALDSFTARTGIPVITNSAGSVEAARRITELRDIPDVIALADEEVIPSLLAEYVDRYWLFARNRMVVAIANDRPPAEKIDSTNWYRVLSQPGIEVGRSDPDLDPAGYRALMVLRLAERAYHDPSIESAVLARSPSRNIRPKSADLTALLETGAIDFAFVYESVARAAGLRWVELPAAINLGDDSLRAVYASVSVTIIGHSRGDSVTIHGTPIVYALAIPKTAPHGARARELGSFLLSPDGEAAMHAAGLDVVAPQAMWVGVNLDHP